MTAAARLATPPDPQSRPPVAAQFRPALPRRSILSQTTRGARRGSAVQHAAGRPRLASPRPAGRRNQRGFIYCRLQCQRSWLRLRLMHTPFTNLPPLPGWTSMLFSLSNSCHLSFHSAAQRRLATVPSNATSMSRVGLLQTFMWWQAKSGRPWPRLRPPA